MIDSESNSVMVNSGYIQDIFNYLFKFISELQRFHHTDFRLFRDVFRQNGTVAYNRYANKMVSHQNPTLLNLIS